jgi:hypothetical protein
VRVVPRWIPLPLRSLTTNRDGGQDIDLACSQLVVWKERPECIRFASELLLPIFQLMMKQTNVLEPYLSNCCNALESAFAFALFHLDRRQMTCLKAVAHCLNARHPFFRNGSLLLSPVRGSRRVLPWLRYSFTRWYFLLQHAGHAHRSEECRKRLVEAVKAEVVPKVLAVLENAEWSGAAVVGLALDAACDVRLRIAVCSFMSRYYSVSRWADRR